MSLKRRNARINDCSPPIDLDAPPSTCADLTIWFNELTLALHHGVAQWPECPRVKSLQTILNAWGRVRTPAGNVENVLKARRIREQTDYDVSSPEPPDDPMVLPLWHAIGLGRMAHDVATAETIDSAAARSIAASVRIAVAGVATRETAETDAFKRHHGIKDAGRMVRQAEDEVAPGPGEIAAQNDLLAYGAYCTPGFRIAPHHRIIADALMRVVRGATKRLIISLPPRSGKSFIVSQHFPAYYLGHHPGRKVMAFSVTADLAGDFGVKTRNLVASAEHTRVFPNCTLAEGDGCKTQFRTSEGGEYFALGIGTVASGRGAHLGIIDDAYNDPAQVASETYKRTLREWYAATFRTRIMPGGAVVVMHTRWAAEDLCGWLLDEHKRDGWEVISIPAVAEDDELWITSEGPWGRKKGEPLDPEWWREEMDDLLKYGKWKPQTTPSGQDPIKEYATFYYAQLAQTLGSRFFSALYQQRPTPGEGGKCKLGWFKRYKHRPGVSRTVVSIDTGQKGGAENDPTVIMVWGEFDGGHAVLDVWRERVIYPRLLPQVIDTIRKWQPDAVLIEDQNNGATLLQDLGVMELANRVPLIGIQPRDSKVVRFDRITPLIESGRVWIPETDSATSWLGAFEEEVTSFPLGKHDDQIDALSQYLNWVRKEGMAFASSGQESFSDPAMTALLGRISGPWSKGGALAGAVGNGSLVFRRR
jgi:predicted phage terminase large subunit-like protein